MATQEHIAVITGAGAGIGRASAQRLASQYDALVIGDINIEALEETRQLLEDQGHKVHAMRLDVGDPESVTAFYAEVKRLHGRLDAQISNAGITDRMAFLDMALERFERILRVNLIGTMLCGQAAARIMVDNGGGRIVNLSSVSGQSGGRSRAAYGASKAAIINLTQTMALELAEYGILVNCIAPGPTQVARTAHGPAQRNGFLGRMAIQRYARPEEIAAAAAFLCSDDASFITGHVLNVDGGFAASGVLYTPSADEPH